MADAAQWDERFSRPGYWAGREPSACVAESLPFLPLGLALDLACGEGRNSVFLARHGFNVVGVDRSAPGLAKAAALAAEERISCRALTAEEWPARREAGRAAEMAAGELALFQSDLKSLTLPPVRFDVVLCVNYLQRSLFPRIVRALAPGGVLVFETYTLEQLSRPASLAGGAKAGPRDPELLLRPGELREAFPALEILAYREYVAESARASLLARKPR